MQHSEATAESLENAEAFHLSHTDQDGYGAQFITRHIYPYILCMNTNYGEVLGNFRRMMEIAKAGDQSKDCIIYVTDLGLSVDEAEQIERVVNAFTEETGRRVMLNVLDHHKSTEDAAAKFPWINLDISMCATKATYHFLENWMDEITRGKLAVFADMVNAQDLWLEDHPMFRRAVLMSDTVYEATGMIPEALPEARWGYMSHLFGEYSQLASSGASTRQIEIEAVPIREKFLHSNLDESWVKDDDLPVKHLMMRYIYEQLSQANVIPVVQYNGVFGLFFFNYPASLFQHVSHHWLREDSFYSFAARVNKDGNISLRAHDAFDVQQLASAHFGGGGHANAAGGRMVVKEPIEDANAAMELFRAYLRKPINNKRQNKE